MKANAQSQQAKDAIAIVGIACRFPGGANSPEQFWKRLREGVDAIREVPENRWDLWRAFDGRDVAPDEMGIRWGGFLEAIEGFDSLFFGISPREARQIDPQQRLMLELAWEALEDAGIVPETLTGSATGVFVGAMWSDYARILNAAPEVMDQYSAAGQDTGIIAGRISYTLGLQGPSFVVNTASSSSLVAVHLARQSLLRHESTLAIVGGVHVIASPLSTVSMTKFGAASARGRCRTFDAEADGYVRGEGGGVVIMKRLSQALLDGDRIYCTVVGSAINNDGFSNGLTSPNPRAQEDVLRLAYQNAGVPPERVHYVEAHGTGTRIGDPLEAGALGAVFGAGRQADAPLRIGSVKSNIGHLEAAGGIAGLVKVALSLAHRAIPKSLHFERPNPHISFDALKLDVQKELTAWPSPDADALAGVSSFGFGGTNCHVVLRAAPSDALAVDDGAGDEAGVAALVPISAKSAEALEAQLRAWAEWLGEDGRDVPLSDIAYTAGGHRTHHAYRACAVGHHHAEIAREFLRLAGAPLATQRAAGASPQVAFLFPAMNGVPVDVVRQLLDEEAFREAFMACDAALQEHTHRSLVAELHNAMVPPDLEAPCAFAVAVSLAALWASWGVEPSAILGRGLGEVAAAHVAGVLDLADAARVLAMLAHHEDETRDFGIEQRAPRVPLWSATRGLLSGERFDGTHWSELLEASEGPARAEDVPCDVLLTVGRDPAPMDSARTVTLVDSLQIGKPARTSLREAFGALHLAGAQLAWSRLFQRKGRVVSLPAYAWQRERCWVDVAPPRAPATESATAHARMLLAKDWTLAPHTHEGPRRRATYLLLVNHDSTIDVLKDLGTDPDIDWIVIRELGLLPRLARSEYEFDYSDYRAGAELIERIGREHPHIDGFVDLADLHASARALPDRDEGRVALLQGLLRQRASAGLRIVHLTRGLVAFQSAWRTLAGAKMASLVRVIGAEHRAVRATTIDVDHGVDRADALLELVVREARSETPAAELCYRQGARYASRYAAMAEERADALRMDPQKVYVVTGATGHLGAEVSRWLVERGARKLALLSQRSLPGRPAWPGGPPERASDADADARLARVAALEALGVETVFFSGPLTDAGRLQAFFEHVERSVGAIGGVIHCAGAIGQNPSSFAQRELAALRATWEPKIDGLVALHGALGEARPDFFVLYSSVSAAVPQLAVGMADYASGNAFLDAFAAYHGGGPAGTRYLAIDWPSWRESGMGERAGARYFELGFTAHDTADGLALLERALGAAGHTSLLPCVVDPASFDAGALLEPKKASPQPPEPIERRAIAPPKAERDLFEATKALVLDLLASELMLPRHRIEGSMTFGAYGVDSVMIADLVPKLERFTREPLEPGAILEHPTLDELSRFLSDSYANGIQSYLAQTKGAPSPSISPTSSVSAQAAPVPPAAPSPRPIVAVASPPTADRRIAVIGMACRFPGAPNIATFLDNLQHGRSSVTEVPPNRWDVQRLYGANHEEGKIISKWGGFLEGIEEFDPAHYGIAEEDAAHVDPLVRIFLECIEQAMRDGGYDKPDVWGKRVGVFAGSGTTNYGYRIQHPTRSTVTGLNQNFIAAYAAHIFNLRGPNLVVDTACSSSLVSLHLACQSLLAGDCEMAVAGGADLLLDEVLYRRLSVAKALSPDGRCHTFDAKANGFVPGEGCGAVLLKPLARAMADGDPIHAVIEGVAVNNDGHTMGLTTPNMKAQEEVILAAHERAGTDPATVSYVEAHGTGTMIGDPIELKALTHVFRRFTDESQFCAIGSVKTNVGHLLLAAGMASLIKVVLSLKHQIVFPTLHCEEPNPRFSFSSSPFYPAQQLRPWLARAGVRRAAISSFGFGGTNGHAIVRGFEPSIDGEYTVQKSPLPPVHFTKKRYWIDPPTQPNTLVSNSVAHHVPKRRPLLALEEGL